MKLHCRRSPDRIREGDVEEIPWGWKRGVLVVAHCEHLVCECLYWGQGSSSLHGCCQSVTCRVGEQTQLHQGCCVLVFGGILAVRAGCSGPFPVPCASAVGLLVVLIPHLSGSWLCSGWLLLFWKWFFWVSFPSSLCWCKAGPCVYWWSVPRSMV